MGLSESGLRVGVAGLGYWGMRHVSVLRTIAEVSEVVGIDPLFGGESAYLSRGPRGLRVYRGIEDALLEIDALVIAVPAAMHYNLAMSAIAARRHVLIEKPMACTFMEARQLVNAAIQADVILMVGHTFEYDLAIQRLREIVLDPSFGRLRHLEFAWLNFGIFREDVNVIFDLASHDVSIANFIIGALPASVAAWGSCHVRSGREDVAYLSLNYVDSDVAVHVHVSWIDPIRVRRIIAVGDEKTAVYDSLKKQRRIQVFNRPLPTDTLVDHPIATVNQSYNAASVIRISDTEPLAAEDRHFVECVINGHQALTDGQSGARAVGVLECAQISIRERRTVFLSEITNSLW